MDLQAFLRPDVLPARETEVILSDRFRDADGNPVPFKLKGISEEENSRIRRSCQRQSIGIEQPAFDRENYLRRFTAACVTSPDLKSQTLQQSWGVMGEEALLGVMLTAGEFARLFVAAREVCGFIAGAEAENVKNTLKKACGGETAN